MKRWGLYKPTWGESFWLWLTNLPFNLRVNRYYRLIDRGIDREEALRRTLGKEE